MENREYKLHSGARLALNVSAVLCCLLIVGIPFGIWIFYRVATGKLILSNEGVTARALGSTKVSFAEVSRFGVASIPVIARGIGGVLARKKVGGDHAIWMVFQTNTGKTRRMIVSQFERYDEVIGEVARTLGRQPEQVQTGVWGLKWPVVS